MAKVVDWCTNCIKPIHRCRCTSIFKRTNDSARSPQEPVVQSACNQTTLPEQPALVVQDGTEPSDRKALSVQSAAKLVGQNELANKLTAKYRVWRKTIDATQLCMVALRVAARQTGNAMLRPYYLELADFLANKEAQVEHEAKRAAAD